MQSVVVPGSHGRAARVHAGQTVRVVNTHGTQVVDFWALRADRPDIAMSMQHSRIRWRNLRPHPGDEMLDEERSVMLTLVEDTSPGVHDTVIAACDPFRYAQLGAAPDHRPAVIDAGNPGMAVGGMGDLLTGVIAALRAQGQPAFDAACVGALLHAAAGDEAARDGGERGLLPSDLLPRLRRLSNPDNVR